MFTLADNQMIENLNNIIKLLQAGQERNFKYTHLVCSPILAYIPAPLVLLITSESTQVIFYILINIYSIITVGEKT